jgi:hypothetical protein
MDHAGSLFDSTKKKEEETPMIRRPTNLNTSPIDPNLRNTEEKEEQKQAAQGRDLYSDSCQASVVCPRRSYHITSRRPQAHKHQPAQHTSSSNFAYHRTQT